MEAQPDQRHRWATEDWLAVGLGMLLLALSLGSAIAMRVNSFLEQLEPPATSQAVWASPLTDWFTQPGPWQDDPRQAFIPTESSSRLPGIVGALVATCVAFGLGCRAMGVPFTRFVPGFLLIFVLATLAYTLAAQSVIEQYNLEYALWALAVGLAISNTVGTPNWARPALRTEFYIKTGLVLY
jgi:hypothetical protein